MLAVRVRLKDGGNRDHRVKHLAAEYRALAKSRSSCQELLTDPFGPPTQVWPLVCSCRGGVFDFCLL